MESEKKENIIGNLKSKTIEDDLESNLMKNLKRLNYATQKKKGGARIQKYLNNSTSEDDFEEENEILSENEEDWRKNENIHCENRTRQIPFSPNNIKKIEKFQILNKFINIEKKKINIFDGNFNLPISARNLSKNSFNIAIEMLNHNIDYFKANFNKYQKKILGFLKKKYFFKLKINIIININFRIWKILFP